MTTKTAPKADTATVSREGAEAIHEKVTSAAKTLVTSRKRLEAAVKEAKEGNVWQVLGHKSWTDYLGATFSKETLGARMPKKDIEWLMGLMATEGASSRVIAEATGTSQSTASRVARKAKSESAAKGKKVEKVTTRDGKSQKSERKATPKAGKAKDTHPAVKAAKAYAAAAKRLTESADFDLASLEGEALEEVQAILNGSRSDMVRAVKALESAAKPVRAAA